MISIIKKNLRIVFYVFVLDRIAADVSTNLAWNKNLWRQEHLQSICNLVASGIQEFPPISELNHLLVDHKHKVLYCYVPKVACTNWKRILMILSGKWNNTNLLSIPGDTAHASTSVTKLSDLSDNEVHYCLNNYTKFLIVRHPFERLLSAYRNKLEGHKQSNSKYFQQRVGKYIIKHYRNDANETSLKNGDDVTFAEFVKYVIAEGNDNRDQNEHWKPISQMCHPCALTYDVIGKYESLVDDSDMILAMVNATFLNFPVTKTAETSKKLKHYFRQLSLANIEQLYNLYKNDFQLFDYNLENIIGYDIG
ncbi:carbohydrate sulfotransferase 11 [Chrysoperla carnea]|uniref:carbohydrate sulfotransferase 11 n=1 Tax=Chrysoperla carnea TaxID=189513 RepID=UPI001D06F74C|nr:carbohydrate sulfotransferase 11 [Chrysoperla carnea]